MLWLLISLFIKEEPDHICESDGCKKGGQRRDRSSFYCCEEHYKDVLRELDRIDVNTVE